jgi:hypothetical protein
MTMRTQEFIEELSAMADRVPERADVLSLRQPSIEEIEARTRRFLSMTAGVCGRSGKEGDWVRRSDHTLVRLPNGARAVAYHASGAMVVTAGLEPMGHTFGTERDRDSLTEQVLAVASQLELDAWVGRGEGLEFERLWQIKASATDPRGTPVEAVTIRALGAYRHFVADLPVWGEASAVVKVASGPRLDEVKVNVRATTGEVVDRVAVVSPEQAARAVMGQLSGLMTGSKLEFTDVARPVALLFGYFSHGKRKTQTHLAPAYVGMVRTEGDETFNYLSVVGASEKEYLPFCRSGDEPSPAQSARQTVSWAERAAQHSTQPTEPSPTREVRPRRRRGSGTGSARR